MFLILFIVLLLAWLFGWAAFHVAGGLIHLLIILAAISLILRTNLWNKFWHPGPALAMQRGRLWRHSLNSDEGTKQKESLRREFFPDMPEGRLK